MNPISTDVFGLAEKRLAWIGQRQAVLAQNIANANTPGYAARDVKPFSEVLAGQAQQTGSTDNPAGVDRTASGRSINGNAVALDEQLEKIAETDTAHQLATNLYKKYVSLFRTAIGRN
jgi:flagellar basal-body rod protein FlgB